MHTLIIDGIKYTIDNETAIVSGFSDDITSDVIIPECIFKSIPVIGIAKKAFYKCSNISSVRISKNVRFIGINAFAWCMSLSYVDAKNVLSIENRAFMGCERLSSICFSSELKNIGDKAFAYCTSLVSLRFPDSLEYMGNSVFEGCRHLKYAYIPKNINTINRSTFYACVSLVQVDMHDNIEYVDEYAFAYCSSISLPSFSVNTVINNNAFYGCDVIKVNCIA